MGHITSFTTARSTITLRSAGSYKLAGVTFRTRCDTEVVLKLFEEEGPSGVRTTKRHVRVRDLECSDAASVPREETALGIKPLYYALAGDGSLVFGSEIKALLASEIIPREMNWAAFPDYLANHAPSGEETLFSGVRRLPPGHTLSWHEGRSGGSQILGLGF